jgi:hypothetical protein
MESVIAVVAVEKPARFGVGVTCQQIIREADISQVAQFLLPSHTVEKRSYGHP